jgi:hypothetical protein
MTLPGFSAESSVYRSTTIYRQRGVATSRTGIIAQAPISLSASGARYKARCQARCTGAFIGGATSCTSTQCIQDRTNEFNNCLDTCDFIAGVIE